MQDNRLGVLDVLRGIAAIMVVIYHTTQAGSQLVTPNANAALGYFWPFNLGSHGVSAFFMISGFVISLSLGRIHQIRQFVLSRFFRLYPIFWVAVLFTVIWRIYVGGDQISISMVLANLTMAPSLFNESYVDGIYWTLAVELQFYVMMAIVWKLGCLTRINLICGLWLGLTVVLKLAQKRWPEVQGIELLWHALLLPYAPFFSLGMLSFYIYRNKKNIASHILFFVALLLVLASGNLDRSIVSVVMAGIFLLIAHGKTESWKIPRIFIYLGEASYCIYLFHQALGYHAMHRMDVWVQKFPIASVVATIFMCVMVGVFMHAWVEKPLSAATRRLKN